MGFAEVPHVAHLPEAPAWSPEPASSSMSSRVKTSGTCGNQPLLPDSHLVVARDLMPLSIMCSFLYQEVQLTKPVCIV